jgi:hypothetical protein
MYVLLNYNRPLTKMDVSVQRVNLNTYWYFAACKVFFIAACKVFFRFYLSWTRTVLWVGSSFFYIYINII